MIWNWYSAHIMSGLTAVYFFFPPRFHWHILAWKLIWFNSLEGKYHTVPAASEPQCKAIQGTFLLCTRLCSITFNGCILSALTPRTRNLTQIPDQISTSLQQVKQVSYLLFLLIDVSQLVQKSTGHQLEKKKKKKKNTFEAILVKAAERWEEEKHDLNVGVPL